MMTEKILPSFKAHNMIDIVLSFRFFLNLPLESRTSNEGFPRSSSNLGYSKIGTPVCITTITNSQGGRLIFGDELHHHTYSQPFLRAVPYNTSKENVEKCFEFTFYRDFPNEKIFPEKKLSGIRFYFEAMLFQLVNDRIGLLPNRYRYLTKKIYRTEPIPNLPNLPILTESTDSYRIYRFLPNLPNLPILQILQSADSEKNAEFTVYYISYTPYLVCAQWASHCYLIASNDIHSITVIFVTAHWACYCHLIASNGVHSIAVKFVTASNVYTSTGMAAFWALKWHKYGPESCLSHSASGDLALIWC